jgi:hypothetical protein
LTNAAFFTVVTEMKTLPLENVSFKDELMEREYDILYGMFFIVYFNQSTEIITCYASDYQLNSKVTLNAQVQTKMKAETKCKALASSLTVKVFQCF